VDLCPIPLWNRPDAGIKPRQTRTSPLTGRRYGALALAGESHRDIGLWARCLEPTNRRGPPGDVEHGHDRACHCRTRALTLPSLVPVWSMTPAAPGAKGRSRLRRVSNGSPDLDMSAGGALGSDDEQMASGTYGRPGREAVGGSARSLRRRALELRGRRCRRLGDRGPEARWHRLTATCPRTSRVFVAPGGARSEGDTRAAGTPPGTDMAGQPCARPRRWSTVWESAPVTPFMAVRPAAMR
jgi:hypothetical protein